MKVPVGFISCPPCDGTGFAWGIRYDGKCPLCKGERLLPNSRANLPTCHFCNGRGKKDGIMPQLCPECGGWGNREPSYVSDPNQRLAQLVSELGVRQHISEDLTQSESKVQILQINAGRPNSAHMEVAELFGALSGLAMVCDPYYGQGSLARLSEIDSCSSVRVLTSKPDSKEKSFLPKRLEEFTKEYPQFEFRKYKGKELHDRYIVTDDNLILMGHGLKDIGGKESFVVKLDRSLAGDTIDSLKNSFDSKWNAAEPL